MTNQVSSSCVRNPKLSPQERNFKFETSAIKHKIRWEILKQAQQFNALIEPGQIVHSNLLPGRGAYLENLLVANHNASATDKRFIFDCFEMSDDIFYINHETRKETPKLLIVNNPFPDEEIGNCRIIYHKGRFYFYKGNELQFSWGDYCGLPNKTEIENFINSIKIGDVIYLTFEKRWRRRDCLHPLIKKALTGTPEQKYRSQLLFDVLESLITKKIGDNFTRIFNVSYTGGMNSPMITMGWHFVKNSSIIPFCPGFIAKPKIKVIKIKGVGKKKGLTTAEKNQLTDLIYTGVTNAEIIAQSKFTEYQIRGVKAYISRIKREKSQSQETTNQ